jgi:hypothetical protein
MISRLCVFLTLTLALITRDFGIGSLVEIAQHFLGVRQPLLIRADQLQEFSILLFRVNRHFKRQLFDGISQARVDTSGG